MRLDGSFFIHGLPAFSRLELMIFDYFLDPPFRIRQVGSAPGPGIVDAEVIVLDEQLVS